MLNMHGLEWIGGYKWLSGGKIIHPWQGEQMSHDVVIDKSHVLQLINNKLPFVVLPIKDNVFKFK